MGLVADARLPGLVAQFGQMITGGSADGSLISGTGRPDRLRLWYGGNGEPRMTGGPGGAERLTRQVADHP